MTMPHPALRPVLWISCAATAALIVAALSQGIHLVIPWSFLYAVAMLLPLGWLVVAIASRMTAARLPGMSGLALGALALVGYSQDLGAVLLPILALPAFAAIVLPKRIPDYVIQTGWGLAAFGVLMMGFWSANYLVISLSGHRFADAVVQGWDAAVFRRVGWDYVGLFPFVSGLSFTALQAAYVFLFAEMAVIVAMLGTIPEHLARYLKQQAFCYGVALTIFAIWPVAGPYLTAPWSLNHSADATVIGMLIQGGQEELRAMLAMNQPLTGYGVFVGFPSLHASSAVLFQWTARHDPVLRWALWPINLLILVATVALGLHYIADTAGGIALGVVAIYLWR